MKKIMVSISLALILGLLVVIPGSTQMQTSSEEVGPSDATSLRLLIAINRLELTQSQMRQVHDILAGLLDEATALEADRDAFAQEMLLFSRGRMRQQFRTQLEDEASGPIADRIREFIDMHPEMRKQMAQRFGVMNQETQRPLGQRGAQSLQQGTQLRVDHPLLAQRLANKRLATLQQIVDILEAKLQYIQ